MGYILKQNKAISTNLLKAMVEQFKSDILHHVNNPKAQWRPVLGLTYTVIAFFASLRGSEALKVDFSTLMKYWEKGNYQYQGNNKGDLPPHIIIPILGRFKGEAGERCHLLPLTNVTSSGIHIRNTLKLLLNIRSTLRISSIWLFTNTNGSKLSFDQMNDIILDKIEVIKDSDQNNNLDLASYNIREDFSINRSFRRGSSTTAQLKQIPTDIIEHANRWKKIEKAKGKRPRFSMIETYSDIELLIPKAVQYSEML